MNDDRLLKVIEYIRQWVFAKVETLPKVEKVTVDQRPRGWHSGK